jgi:hypothetical protein
MRATVPSGRETNHPNKCSISYKRVHVTMWHKIVVKYLYYLLKGTVTTMKQATFRDWRTPRKQKALNKGSTEIKNCLTKHRAMKTYWGVEVYSTHSLTSALDGGEWLASHPGSFIPREIAPGTYGIGGWVGPRAVLDAVVKRKIPSPSRELNPRTTIVQPVAQRYTDWAITAVARKLIELKFQAFIKFI